MTQELLQSSVSKHLTELRVVPVPHQSTHSVQTVHQEGLEMAVEAEVDYLGK